MLDSQAMKAERPVQVSFIKRHLLQALAVPSAIMLFASWMAHRPNWQALGSQLAEVRFEPVGLSPKRFGAARLVGAWQVTSDDPRFGGISALALAGDQFVALTDSGVVARFGKPEGASTRSIIGELPDGPGAPGFKHNRDSEALVWDARRQGWWVGFEHRNELWLYDRTFARVLGRITLGRKSYSRNTGPEALVVNARKLLLLPEGGRAVVELGDGAKRTYRIMNPAGNISDALRLPSGELLVVRRQATILGFANSIANLSRTEHGYAYSNEVPLGVGKLDNVEAVAAEARPSGVTRLWLMTDDNWQAPLRTLLIAVDLPVRRPERRPPS
jgi:hypothetical protein